MSEPIASEAPAEASEGAPSLIAITGRVLTSHEFALRVMIGVVGAFALGWLGPPAALLGLILSQLLGDVVKEVVTSRKWSLRRMWLVVALLLLFDFGRRAWAAIRKRSVQRRREQHVETPGCPEFAAPPGVRLLPRAHRLFEVLP